MNTIFIREEDLTFLSKNKLIEMEKCELVLIFVLFSYNRKLLYTKEDYIERLWSIIIELKKEKLNNN